MTPEELQKKLADITESASGSGSSITRAAVDSFFREDPLSPEQMVFVYDYLLAKGIRVDGYRKTAPASKGRPDLPEDERRELRQYRESLRALPPETDGERQCLLEEILAGGGETAIHRMTELFMPLVPEEALRHWIPEIHISDLIQEGNLHLFLAVSSLTGGPVTAEDLEEYILREVRQGMQVLCESSRDMKVQDRHMVSKAEDLKDSIAILKEELGRKVYLDEVADFMNISEEEAEAIFKLTGEEMAEEE